MSIGAQFPVPADEFLDQVISALIRVDAATLQQLESLASGVAAPRNFERFVQNRAVFAALLDATARNLRLLRRVTGTQFPDLYHPC